MQIEWYWCCNLIPPHVHTFAQHWQVRQSLLALPSTLLVFCKIPDQLLARGHACVKMYKNLGISECMLRCATISTSIVHTVPTKKLITSKSLRHADMQCIRRNVSYAWWDLVHNEDQYAIFIYVFVLHFFISMPSSDEATGGSTCILGFQRLHCIFFDGFTNVPKTCENAFLNQKVRLVSKKKRISWTLARFFWPLGRI